MNLVRASRIFASEDDLVNQQRNLAKRTNRQIKQVVKGKTPLRKKTPSRYVKKVNK